MKLVKDIFFPDSDQWMASEYEEGRTQYDTVNTALSFLTKTRSVVNAGSHVGLYVLEFCKIFDTVYAFEPCAETFECLLANTRNCNNVEALRVALGDVAGGMAICQDTAHIANTGGNYLVPGGIDCTSVLLDSFDIPDLDLLFLDAEGMEYQILNGGLETIRRCNPVIVCEEKTRLMARQGVDSDGVRKFLAKLGYLQAARSHGDFVYVTRS